MIFDARTRYEKHPPHHPSITPRFKTPLLALFYILIHYWPCSCPWPCLCRWPIKLKVEAAASIELEATAVSVVVVAKALRPAEEVLHVALVKVDTNVWVTVKVANTTGQVLDSLVEDVWAAPDGDVVEEVPALVKVPASVVVI
jgi:hypothetical protein